jgi:hypothetical protein
MANELDAVPFLEKTFDAQSIVEISSKDGVLYANIKANGFFMIRLLVSESDDSAKKMFNMWANEPSVPPNAPPIPSLGELLIDSVVGWTTPTSGSIVVRSGNKCALVYGAGTNWSAVVDQATRVAGLLKTMDTSEFLAATKSLENMQNARESMAAVQNKIGADVKLEDVSTFLRDPKLDVKKRTELILKVAQSTDKEAATDLILSQCEEQYPASIRNNVAIRSLGNVGTPRAFAKLVSIIEKQPIGDIADDESQEAMLRRNVASALAEIDTSASIAQLRLIRDSEREYQTVKELAGALLASIESRRTQE